MAVIILTVATVFVPNSIKDYVQAAQLVALAGLGVLSLRAPREPADRE